MPAVGSVYPAQLASTREAAVNKTTATRAKVNGLGKTLTPTRLGLAHASRSPGFTGGSFLEFGSVIGDFPPLFRC